jgi:hypothetical protein
MDSSDWSNGIRYHTFDARSDTEFNRHSLPGTLPYWTLAPWDNLTDTRSLEQHKRHSLTCQLNLRSCEVHLQLG